MKFQFTPHVIDLELPTGARYAQTALADLDNDGQPEYIVGQRGGSIFCYKYHTPDDWTRHLLGEDSVSDVGGCVLDVDGDGWLDFVTGGVWYRNTRDLEIPFERIIFDPELANVHDIVAADINGDGRMEVITMSDKNSTRWYRIPADCTQGWERHDIGPAVHAGISVGDLDGDGHLDIVRTNIWFQNLKGDGTVWTTHEIGPNTPPPPDFHPPSTYDATRSFVCDMNGDGKNDIVFTDAEIPGGKIWWMENIDGKGVAWLRHDVPHQDTARRGAYHTLYVGDLDGDGDYDIFTCEMEGKRHGDVGGESDPRWYIWENLDGKGGAWQEHVILDANLGGHEAVVGDVTGNGLPDIIGKPWRPHQDNAYDGRMFVVFLENVSDRAH